MMFSIASVRGIATSLLALVATANLTLFGSPTLQAAPIEYQFTGKIKRNASNNFSDPGLPGIAVNDSFTGKIIFDDSATDTESHTSIGRFSVAGPPIGESLIQMNVNGLTFTSGIAISITTNNDIFNRDLFSMLSLGFPLPTGWSVDGSPTKSASFSLSDSSQTAFSTDALPTSLDLSDFTTHVRFGIAEQTGSQTITLNHSGGSTTYLNNVYLDGTLETLTLVPEPSSALLAYLGLGLLGLGFNRRRRE